MSPEIFYTKIVCSECETQIEPGTAVIFAQIGPAGVTAEARCKNSMICAENKRERASARSAG